jgi:hypothetical protein
MRVARTVSNSSDHLIEIDHLTTPLLFPDFGTVISLHHQATFLLPHETIDCLLFSSVTPSRAGALGSQSLASSRASSSSWIESRWREGSLA